MQYKFLCNLELHINCSPWLNIFNLTYHKRLKLHLNSPPWLEKFLNSLISNISIAFKFSTMVGENFEFYWSHISQIAFKFSTREIFKFIDLEYLKLHLYSLPWLEKILNFTDLECLKLHSNSPLGWRKFWILLIWNVLNCI